MRRILASWAGLTAVALSQGCGQSADDVSERTSSSSQALTACTGCPAPTPNPGWQPALSSRWQWQLNTVNSYASTGGINLTMCVSPPSGGPCVRPVVYDIDLYNIDGVTPNSQATTAIHAQGGKAICYVDAGTWENWRPDQQ